MCFWKGVPQSTTVAAAVRENLDLSARPCMGFTKSPPFNLEVGMRDKVARELLLDGNQVMAVLVEELLLLWANKGPAVSWAPEWKAFEMLIWADNIFLSFEFHHRHCAEDTRH